MTTITLSSPHRKSFSIRKAGLISGGLLLVALLAGLAAWWTMGGSQPQILPQVIPQVAFEKATGIRPKMVAVTAAGGMLDFRYQVLDPDRANEVFEDAALHPRLIVEDSGTVIYPGEHHSIPLVAGNTYFMFYPNSSNAVKTGSTIWIATGDTRFGPIIAK